MIVLIQKNGRTYKKHTCDSCNLLRINGIVTHETGCPEAWKDYKVSCKWCGSEFYPVEKYQICCSEECAESYYY